MKNRIVSVFLLFLCVFNYECSNNRKVILDDEYEGKISSIYLDKKNHSIYKFDIEEDKGNRFVVADLFPKSWKYATIGDSIYKKKGESFIIIKKNDGSSKFFETRVR